MTSRRQALAVLRLLCKSCCRQPLLMGGASLFLVFVYVFAVGRHGWNEHSVPPDPYPAQVDLASLLREKDLVVKELKNVSAVTTTERSPTAPPSDDEENVAFELAQKIRLERIREVCDTPGRPVGFVNSLISTAKANLTYCMTPRSANTFWLQMFRFAQRDFPDSPPESPLDLDPRLVRTHPFIRVRKYNWKMLPQPDRDALLQTKLFLSVQDPYWRLWTTYLNALTLPDLWTSLGARIEVQRPPVLEPIKRKKAAPCGDTVTFAEFVQYVLTAYEPDLQPFHSQCDPCTLPFTYIIKSNTAKRDNRYILNHLNLTWAVEFSDVEAEMRKRYIKSLIFENFERLQDIRIQRCVSFGDLAKRLWHSFVLQGILRDTAEMPSGMDDLHQVVFADKVVQLAEQAGLDSAEKRKYMIAAFRHLDKATLQAVRKKFDMDFKLFGFDPEPADIYS